MEENNMLKVKESIIIATPPDEVFKFWRRLENLPVFMDHLKEVTKINNSIYHWRAKAPLGSSVEWDAVITNEIGDKLIQWESLENSEVQNSGSVWFTEWKDSNNPSSSTLLEVEMTYRPPFGKLGAAIATVFGENPQQQIKEDLQKLKTVLES